MHLRGISPAKSLFAIAALLSLALYTTPRAFASAQDEVASALSTSKQWVEQIDAGQFDESYADGCEAMRQKVSQDNWVLVLKTIRSSWGPVVSRRQTSHIFKPNGYDGLEGECMVITYDTSFKKLDAAIEVVVLKWEGGKWRGAGYNAEAKPTGDDGSQVPQNQTETQTQEHVTPQPQTP